MKALRAPLPASRGSAAPVDIDEARLRTMVFLVHTGHKKEHVILNTSCCHFRRFWSLDIVFQIGSEGTINKKTGITFITFLQRCVTFRDGKPGRLMLLRYWATVITPLTYWSNYVCSCLNQKKCSFIYGFQDSYLAKKNQSHAQLFFVFPSAGYQVRVVARWSFK